MTGQFSEDTYDGEGMLFFYKPNMRFSKKPWVKIDGMGFRNPKTVKPGENVDVAIFGDSVMIALGSHKDIGDMFRDSGISTVNYAMGSYSAAQYPVALKRFILDRNIRPRIVIVGICMANDIPDVGIFQATAKAGGDFRSLVKKRAD